MVLSSCLPPNSYIHFGRAVPDGVASPETDPLRNGAVLLLGLGQLLLGAEGLVGLCNLYVRFHALHVGNELLGGTILTGILTVPCRWS